MVITSVVADLVVPGLRQNLLVAWCLAYVGGLLMVLASRVLLAGLLGWGFHRYEIRNVVLSLGCGEGCLGAGIYCLSV